MANNKSIKLGFMEKAKLAFNILTAPSLQMKSSGAGIQLYTPEGRFAHRGPYELAKDGYNANAIAYACIYMVATAASSVPLGVFRKRVSRTGIKFEQVFDSAEYNKFISRPNGHDGRLFQFGLHAFRQIAGDAFILSRFRNLENRPVGTPIAWDLARPDRVTADIIDGRIASWCYITPGGTVERYENPIGTKGGAILQIKDFNPLSDFYGMSALEPAGKQVDITNQAARFNKAMLDNGARLTIALKSSENLSDDEAENIRQQFLDTYSGTINAGRPIFLDNGLEIEELGISPKDMEFTEGQLNGFRLIANTIGVPPFLLGLPGNSATFNNMNEAKVHFYQTTVKNCVDALYGDTDGVYDGEVNIYLSKFFGEELYIKPMWDKVDALADVRKARYEKAKQLDGIATLDEQRAIADPMMPALNMPGISNMPWRPSTQQPISFATKPEPQQPVDKPKPVNGNQESGKEPESEDPAEESQPAKKHFSVPEFKLINTSNPADRDAEVLLFAQLMQPYEKRWADFMQAMITKQGELAASTYFLRGNADSLDAVFENTFQETLDFYSREWTKIMNFFGRRVMDALGKHDFAFIERKQAESLFDQFVRRFITEWGAREVRLQEETTKTDIRNAILAGEEAGESRREITKRIQGAAGGAVSKRRARVIAQTETHSAASYAQKYAAISQTGSDYSEWTSAEDSRVRPTHAAADGQRRKDGELFVVGGYKAKYPGDPMLPASERINCRCILRFVIEEKPEGSLLDLVSGVITGWQLAQPELLISE